MAILKAGAYGHGLVDLGKYLEAQDIAFIGVASVVEARKLSQAGVQTPLYLLGPTYPEERPEIVAQRWIPSISQLEEAKHFDALNAGKPPLNVHLTIDTGMGRGGFLPADIPAILPQLLALPNLHLQGIGSHLPSADEDKEFTLQQLRVFEQLLQQLNHPFEYAHIGNSAGLLDYPLTQTNLVRPGLALYGISPLPAYQGKLRRAMRFCARISIVRELPTGHGISYGRTTILQRPTRVATIGAGYGDGYPRSLSGNQPEVIIHGVACPILGRVTMDQIIVDVTEVPEAKAGDIAELFGETITVEELATKAGTIPWEILTRITSRVTRVFVGD